MGSLLALAPEAKALLSTPGQLRQTTEDIANLKKEYELIRGHFNSVKAKLEAAERKLADSGSENLRLYNSLAVGSKIYNTNNLTNLWRRRTLPLCNL